MNYTSKTIRLLSLASLILLLLAGGCAEKKKNTELARHYVIPDSLLRTLTMDTVRQTDMVTSITFTGIVDFDQDKQVNIFPLVSGNVSDIKVQLGDYVNAGQPLATIRSSEMAGYANSLVAAETSVLSARKQLDATSEMFKGGLASSLDLVNAQTAYDQAVAQLEMTKRILKINGDNKGGVWVAQTPVSGFVVQKNITNGTAIRADNGNNIFTISDLKNVWVWANVYESNISNVHLGDEVSLTTLSYPGRKFHGKVDKVLNALDPATKVMKVRIVVPNPDFALKPQMFASVIISNPENKKALSVSSTALIYDNSRYFVLVYKDKGEAVITPVEVVNPQADRTYIISGVKEGDRVISSGALLIYGELNS